MRGDDDVRQDDRRYLMSASPTRSPARLSALDSPDANQVDHNEAKRIHCGDVKKEACLNKRRKPPCLQRKSKVSYPNSEQSSTSTLLPSYDSTNALCPPLPSSTSIRSKNEAQPSPTIKGCGTCCIQHRLESSSTVESPRWWQRLIQARFGPIRLVYLLALLLCSVGLLATLLPLFIPQKLSFTVLDVEATSPYTIIDADTWTADINMTIAIFNPNYRHITWSSLTAHLYYPFYTSTLAAGTLDGPHSLPRRSESTWTIPLHLTYTFQHDSSEQPGQGGLDIAISCGYLGTTFIKPLFYTVHLFGQKDPSPTSSGEDLEASLTPVPVSLVSTSLASIAPDLMTHTPTLWQTTCPFLMSSIPENLRHILPQRIQTLTSATVSVADKLGGAEGVIQAANDVVSTVGRTIDDVASVGSAISNWFS